jgi:hypothetical protein
VTVDELAADLERTRSDVLAAVALVQMTGQSSVELSLTAQGRVSWQIKTYHPDVQQAADQSQAIHDALTTKYPRGDGK